MHAHQPFNKGLAAENGLSGNRAASRSILVVDVGGSKVKILASGKTRPRRAMTGREFTPANLVDRVKKLAHGWEHEALTIGLPSPVGWHGIQTEPLNLGSGWVGFDFASAFEAPVKVVNDAVLQALGSYDGGRMVFLGLGTGLGSTLIAGHIIVPMELSHFPYDAKRTLGDILNRRGMDRFGKGEWRRAVKKIVPILLRAFLADYVVLGGGNAKNIKDVPAGARLGHNLTSFRGGFRLWQDEPHWELAVGNGGPKPASATDAHEKGAATSRHRHVIGLRA